MINTLIKNSTLKCSLLAVALGCGLSASAQTITTSTNFPVGLEVPDDAPSGLASSKIISTPIAYITKVKATLKLSGTWNGDMYCYLVHSSGRTVLLNRVGRRAASSLGYGDEGFDVTFDDAANDIHTYRVQVTGNQSVPIPGVLTNVWAPDARTSSPYSVLDTDSRPALLSSFNGLNPNGEWILFVADLESGDIFTLDNWGLEITGYTPPSIASAPIDATAECTSGSVSFSVSALGSTPLGYNWRFNGSPISGATSTSLTIDHPTFASAGSYDVVITNNYGSLTSSIASLTVQDTTPPAITLLGENPLYVECHSSFVDPGATASDICAGDLTSRITVSGGVNANVPGSYTVNYNVNDPSGNAATTMSRTVIVRDTLAPVPNLASLSDVLGQCSASVTAPTATDACDGVITATTSDPLTYNSQGDFVVHWTYTDGHGNSASQTQNVKVHDTNKPVITLVGNSSVTVECHTGYTDAGATASDNCDGDITSRISVVNAVDANTPGTYTVTYNVSDTVGNAAVQVSRTVIVSDSIAPVVTLVGAASMTNECHTSFTDPGATANDNCASSMSVVTSGSVNPNAVGTYTLTYTATDPSGNAGTASRTVYVVDTTPPSVVIPGNITVYTTNASGTAVSYTVSASDACSGPITPICSPVSGTTCPIGTSTVTVSATDGNGNASNCTFSVTVILNHAPVAKDSTLGAVENHSRTLLIEKLLAKATDADGDALTVSAVSATSTNGGTVTLTDTAIIYTPAANFVGTDLFTYTVGDSKGGFGSASIVVQVMSENDPSLHRINSLTVTQSGVTISFVGIPGYSYSVERAATAAGPWNAIGSFTVPDNGIAYYTDSQVQGQGFYRTSSQ